MEKDKLVYDMQNSERWSEELSLLSSIIIKAPLDKAIKWGSEVFTYNGKNVVSYGGFKNYFAIWFYNGVFLNDRYKVLVSATEGVTKSLRQWRFNSRDEVDENKILEYIYDAIEVEKKGLKVKPEKFKMIEMPKLLADELDKDEILKDAFYQFTPGKQKEFMEYITYASQETTKLNRLEKIKPMILEKIGLNDKYKLK